MFKFVLLCPKRWFQLNSRLARTHFPSIMTFNNWKMVAETRSYIFRWRFRFRRRRVCLSSLLLQSHRFHHPITVKFLPLKLWVGFIHLESESKKQPLRCPSLWQPLVRCHLPHWSMQQHYLNGNFLKLCKILSSKIFLGLGSNKKTPFISITICQIGYLVLYDLLNFSNVKTSFLINFLI